MKKISRVAALVALGAVTLSASGWRIPEQSLNSTALSAAYVAGANGADASYYNPANMAFMEDGASLEMALTYINLPSINYTDSFNAAYNSESKVENFIMPTFHYVSPKMGNLRYGLSIVAPAGLSKRWDDAYQMLKAEEFSLQVIEVNPTLAYSINEQFAIGMGLRAVYSSGVIKLQDLAGLSGTAYKNEMEADSIDFGYNLALSYKPTDTLTLSSTYRSKIDLTVEGDATGWLVHPTLGHIFNTAAETSVPLPAVLTLATSYNFGKTNVEFVYERTYWSAYKNLEFKFPNDALVDAAFGAVTAKDWKDANAYRIGVTHQYSDKLKLMAGFAYDEAGADEKYIGFELPESDAKLYSAGFEYKLDEKMSVGLAYLYDSKESISVDHRTVTNPGGVSGTFEDASAHLVTASFKYKF